jgi:acetyl esterase/lipase
MAAFATDSAERGYVGVAIMYRVRPEGHDGDTTPAALDAYDDTIAAVEWLKDNAATYRIDPDAIVAAGHSSGGANALNAVYLPGERGPAEPNVAGAILTSGWETNAATKAPGRPPVIWHHGANDFLAHRDTMQAECAEIRAAGNECEWVLYEGSDHFSLFDETAAIGNRSALFVFERILWPLGYRAESVD